MLNLLQILFLTFIEAILVFKFIKFPLNIIFYLVLVTFQISILGFYFSPDRSLTLRSDYNRISPLYDGIVESQDKISANTSDKKELQRNLEIFNQRLSSYEGAFPNPDTDIQDRYCRDWFLASLRKFRLYAQVSKALAQEHYQIEEVAATQLVESLNLANEELNRHAQLLAIRVGALDQSLFQSIFAGLLTWIHLAASPSK
jgi:hypothetical protein